MLREMRYENAHRLAKYFIMRKLIIVNWYLDNIATLASIRLLSVHSHKCKLNETLF
jgi:hypothetical protein